MSRGTLDTPHNAHHCVGHWMTPVMPPCYFLTIWWSTGQTRGHSTPPQNHTSAQYFQQKPRYLLTVNV